MRKSLRRERSDAELWGMGAATDSNVAVSKSYYNLYSPLFSLLSHFMNQCVPSTDTNVSTNSQWFCAEDVYSHPYPIVAIVDDKVERTAG